MERSLRHNEPTQSVGFRLKRSCAATRLGVGSTPADYGQVPRILPLPSSLPPPDVGHSLSTQDATQPTTSATAGSRSATSAQLRWRILPELSQEPRLTSFTRRVPLSSAASGDGGMRCPTCHGRGWVRRGETHHMDQKEACKTCKGFKIVDRSRYRPSPRPDPIPPKLVIEVTQIVTPSH